MMRRCTSINFVRLAIASSRFFFCSAVSSFTGVCLPFFASRSIWVRSAASSAAMTFSRILSRVWIRSRCLAQGSAGSPGDMR